LLNTLHLITNTPARLQTRQLCCGKQNSDSVLYFIVTQKSTIPLRWHLGTSKAHRKWRI